MVAARVRGRVRAHRLIVAGASLVSTAVAAQTRGDDTSRTNRWTTSAEIGALFGSTWLVGNNNPTITTTPGVMAGLTVNRIVGEKRALGLASRFSAQPLSLREHDMRWSAGTLTQFDMLLTASLFLPEARGPQIAVNVGGGATVLGGARNLTPFRDVARVVPLVEAGMTLHRTSTRHARDQAVFVRYGVLRIDASSSGLTTTGWVRRLAAGVSLSR